MREIAYAVALALAAAGGGAKTPAPEPPRSLAYVLQAEGLSAKRQEAVRALALCGRDWVVLDTSYDGSPGGAWTAQELAAVRGGKPGRRVLAYLSVGEAEDYRSYWRRAWDAAHDGKPDPGAPAWLGSENPDWKGNYRVKYWSAAWQDLTLARVDEAVKQGFDGLYLDLVDAFEFYEYEPAKRDWRDDRPNPETGHTYRADMCAWVQRLAERARAQRAGCLVVPQNGAQLLAHQGFAELVDAIGVEDLFTDGNRLQPQARVNEVADRMEPLVRAGKPVFVIEYATRAKSRQRAEEGARQRGFALLLAERELNTLGSCPGTEER